jgi:ribosome biogenesis GTPase A
MKRDNDASGPSRALYNWYPGHMARALREIKEKLKMVDIVLEIRDARVPLASGNRSMNEGIGQKPKLILLNKSNLSDPVKMKLWSDWFTKQGEPFLFVNSLDKATLKTAIKEARRIVTENRKISNPDYVETKSKLKMMIVGLPNTGKSSIINQLAGKNATKVADKPGQTQIQQWIAIENDVELLDTPGVMPPMVEKEEHGLWLSAIHAIPDDIAGEEKIAEFLVKSFLEIKSEEFLSKYKIPAEVTSIDEALLKIAITRGCVKQKGLPDLDRVHKLILNDFRKGDLGRICFGNPPRIS